MERGGHRVTLVEDLLSSKDAVKKGDKSILDTIGNLYQKIKLTTKDVNGEMMDMILSCGHGMDDG